ncbi:hypothetical protein BKA70DRAFT_1229713 [Coprinopsis sp. MPI-PUGE-AT-0042]|nr:hypothetical protein BKA70DRAFT_1229713 [Coprinopsis sp. MPI-PUGE-AT-0042]
MVLRIARTDYDSRSWYNPLPGKCTRSESAYQPPPLQVRGMIIAPKREFPSTSDPEVDGIQVLRGNMVWESSIEILASVQHSNVQHRLSHLSLICFHPCCDTALKAHLTLQETTLWFFPLTCLYLSSIATPYNVGDRNTSSKQTVTSPRIRMELVEDAPCGCRRKTIARPLCGEDQDDPPNAEAAGSADASGTVWLNLRTLGLDSVMPHDSPDFTIAAVKLGRAARARAEVLERVDRAVDDLRVLIDSFNTANDNVALSASLYEAVRTYHSRPKISRVMAELVDALHPLDSKASQP